MSTVSGRESTPLELVFPRRELFRGAALRGLVFSTLGSVCLCLFLIVLLSLVDLFVTRGETTIDPQDLADHAELYQTLTGRHEPPQSAGSVALTDSGVLPTLWRFRDSFWIGPAARAYAAIPVLRTNRAALGGLVGAAAILIWFRGLFASGAQQAWSAAALGAANRLRKSIHRQSLRMGAGDLDGGASQQAFELFTTSVDEVRDGVVAWLGCHGRDLLRLALIALCLLAIDSVFTLVSVVPLLSCWFLIERAESRRNEQQGLLAAQSARDLRVLGEGLTKTQLVRGYQMEALEQEQFQKALDRFQEAQAATMRHSAWSRRLTRTAATGAAAFVLLFLGWRVLLPPYATPLAVGVAVIAGFALAWQPLKRIAGRREATAAAELASTKIQQYTSQIPEVGQAVGARFLQPLTRMLTFENVHYSTPKRKNILAGFNAKIPAGRQVAFISTDPIEALAALCLVPRFIEPQQGRILIDGEDVAWVTLESLRAEAILVGGEDPILSATIRENIAGGIANRALPEITEAAKIAHAHNFIQRLPQGYETVVGEQGTALDPGQSFRLGLARAALRKPALLMIEEPAVPLDEDAKALLDDAYKRLAQDRTVLYLARRLSTLRRCDEIIFIHRGKLAAIGPRDRLVQTSPLYRHWEYVNFNEFRHEFESQSE